MVVERFPKTQVAAQEENAAALSADVILGFIMTGFSK